MAYAIPKECYALYQNLATLREANMLSFDDMLCQLTEHRHWSVVDWAKASRRKREEIGKTPFLLVCHQTQTIEKRDIYHSVEAMNAAIDNGNIIMIATCIAHRWDYPLLSGTQSAGNVMAEDFLCHFFYCILMKNLLHCHIDLI